MNEYCAQSSNTNQCNYFHMVECSSPPYSSLTNFDADEEKNICHCYLWHPQLIFATTAVTNKRFAVFGELFQQGTGKGLLEQSSSKNTISHICVMIHQVLNGPSCVTNTPSQGQKRPKVSRKQNLFYKNFPGEKRISLVWDNSRQMCVN